MEVFAVIILLIYGLFDKIFNNRTISMIATIALLGWIIWRIIRFIIKIKPSSSSIIEANIDNMGGHEFERWCANLLRHSGFSSVIVTRGSGDQGVDITAYRDGKKYAIQCKRYKKKLGNKPVQEIHTGKTIYHCDVAVVMTNNYFTQGAIDAARATGVLLWDRNTLQRMMHSAKSG